MAEFPNHFREAPSPQHAFDLFKGEWFTRLPDACGWVASTGPARHCEDYRVHWAQEQLGSFAGQRILELGPMEGGHAYMLEQMGAAEVIAIEANARAFLKCLVLKEAFGLTKVRFQLGDFLPYLRTTSDHYSVGFACGVLYHLPDPVELIALLALRCQSVFIWTHYYDPAFYAAHPDAAAYFQAPAPAVTAGFAHSRYRKSYGIANQQPGFCGGDRDASWLTQADILGAFRHFGFRTVSVVEEKNPNGSAMLLAVTRA